MAADINSVTIVGRLTADPELRNTASGSAVCTARVAVNGRTKVGEEWKDEAHFFAVSLFGRQAESLAQYCAKGHRIAVSGRLAQRTWEAQDGTKRTKREAVGIVAQTVQFLQGKQEGAAQPTSTQPVAAAAGGQDDDVPF